MTVVETFARTIDTISAYLGLSDVAITATERMALIARDPLLPILTLTLGIASVAFLLAFVALIRRTEKPVEFPALENRLQAIEALLRDINTARALRDRKLHGDIEFIRHELAELRGSREETSSPPVALRAVSNG